MLEFSSIWLSSSNEREQRQRIPPIKLQAGQIGVVGVDNEYARIALIRHLAGLNPRPSLGWKVSSTDTTALAPQLSRNIGIIFSGVESQFSGFFQSVECELGLPLSLAGVSRPRQQASIELQLRAWGLFPVRKAPINNLSSGQKQRLLFASMLLSDNELLIVDGALDFLDPAERNRITAFLKVYCKATGKCILFVAPNYNPIDISLVDFSLCTPNVIAGAPLFQRTHHHFDLNRDFKTLVEIDNLNWQTPDTCFALYGGLSAKLLEGQIIAIRGPNGSGKSSLIRLLSGKTDATSGQIWVRGRYPRETYLSGCRGIAYSSAEPDLTIVKHTVAEEIVQASDSRIPQNDFKRIKQLLGFDDSDGLKPFDLGPVARRRMCILRAMAIAEDIIFLDEPTADTSHDELLSFMEAINICSRNGILVICATNDGRFLGGLRFDQEITLPSAGSSFKPLVKKSLQQLQSNSEVQSDKMCVSSMCNTLNSMSEWNANATRWIENSGEFCLFWVRYVYPMLDRYFRMSATLPANVKLFDIGCGYGLHTRAVAQMIQDHGSSVVEVIGIDAVHEFIKTAEFGFGFNGNSKFTYYQSNLQEQKCLDLIKPKLPNSSCSSLVVAFFSLHDIGNLGAVRDILKLLRKPGAIFIAVLVAPYYVEGEIEHSESELISEKNLPAQSDDWIFSGRFQVTSHRKPELKVPYFHRSIKFYVELIEGQWGAVNTISSKNMLTKEGHCFEYDHNCKHDDIVLLTSIAC